jgi:hypothetical protein
MVMDIYEFANKFLKENKDEVYYIDGKYGEEIRNKKTHDTIFSITWYKRNGCIKKMSVENAIEEIKEYEEEFGVKFKY